jgi:hypothetical protein
MKIIEKVIRFGRGHCCLCDSPCHHIGPIRYCERHDPRSQHVGTTTDPLDPRLGHGVDGEPIPQHDVYLILSDEERAADFVRPVRRTYLHQRCGTTTTMSLAIAETYARDPGFYGATYCVQCAMHLPVGAAGEFVWIEPDGAHGPKVGT